VQNVLECGKLTRAYCLVCVVAGSGVRSAVVAIQQRRVSEQLHRLGRQNLAPGQRARRLLTYLAAGQHLVLFLYVQAFLCLQRVCSVLPAHLLECVIAPYYCYYYYNPC